MYFKSVTMAVQYTPQTLCQAFKNNNRLLIEQHAGVMLSADLLDVVLDANWESNYDLLLASVTDHEKVLSYLIMRRDIKTFTEVLKLVNPNNDHMLLACQYQCIEIVEMLLQHRLLLNDKCFELMFLHNNLAEMTKHGPVETIYQVDTKKKGNYISSTSSIQITYPTTNINTIAVGSRYNTAGFLRDTTPFANKIADQIELFIRNGYMLMLEDLTRLIRRGLYVHDIARFNFTFNDAFFDACFERKYWPYSPISVPFPNNYDLMPYLCIINDTHFKKLLENGIKLPTNIYGICAHDNDTFTKTKLVLEYVTPTIKDMYIIAKYIPNSDILKLCHDKVGKW